MGKLDNVINVIMPIVEFAAQGIKSLGLVGNILGDYLSDLIQSGIDKVGDRVKLSKSCREQARLISEVEPDELRALILQIAAELRGGKGSAMPEEKAISALVSDIYASCEKNVVTLRGVRSSLASCPAYTSATAEQRAAVDAVVMCSIEAYWELCYQSIDRNSVYTVKCVEALLDNYFGRFEEKLSVASIPTAGAALRAEASARQLKFTALQCPDCLSKDVSRVGGGIICASCGTTSVPADSFAAYPEILSMLEVKLDRIENKVEQMSDDMKQERDDIRQMSGDIKRMLKLLTEDTAKTARLSHNSPDMDVREKYREATLCFEGESDKRDWGRAFLLFSECAEQGHVPSVVKIGEFYEKGIYVSKNMRSAVKSYVIAASLGSAEAQYRLGNCYRYGRGVVRSLKRATEQYELAATQSHVEAMFILGESGLSRKGKNQQTSLELLVKAGEKKHTGAQYCLAKYYLSNNNGKLAAMWLERACTLGHVDSQYELAKLYSNGIGVSKDAKRAAELYLSAAGGGNAEAQYCIFKCYYYGDGVERNLGAAATWCKRASESGLAKATEFMGHLYEIGEGVARDLYKAVDCYERAVAEGCTRASYYLGRCYEDGDGVTRSLSRAVKYYNIAARDGIAEAQYKLGIFYEEGFGVRQNCNKAAVWFERAAGGAHADAQFKIGIYYYNGEFVKKNYILAKDYLTKAKDNGHSKAASEIVRLGLNKLVK